MPSNGLIAAVFTPGLSRASCAWPFRGVKQSGPEGRSPDIGGYLETTYRGIRL